MAIKKLVLVGSILTMLGCSDAREITYPIIPEELKDCKFFILTSSGGPKITVARCPNSVTSTQVQVGKLTQTTITINGTEYIKKDQQGE